jgi:hypothetical protein
MSDYRRTVEYKVKNHSLSPRWWWMLLVLLLIIGGLFLIYPWRHFQAYFDRPVPVSETSLLYLQQLSDKYKDNKQIKLQYISHQLALGYVMKAENSLLEVKKSHLSTAERREVNWLSYILAREKFYSLEKSSGKYAQQKENLIAQLELVWPLATAEADYRQLANDSAALGLLTLANQTYALLIAKYPQQAVDVYVQAAQVAVQAKDFLAGSEYYFKAMNLTKVPQQKSQYFYDAVISMEYNGNAAAALTAAEEYISQVKVDQSLAVFMTKLALRANHPAVAQEYILKALLKPVTKSTAATA